MKTRLRYRVVSKREGSRPKVCVYATLAAAQKRLVLLGPEPWKAYGKGPDDLKCCAGGYECNCGGRTEREVTDDMRAEMPPLEWVRIDVREVTPWRPLESEEEARRGE